MLSPLAPSPGSPCACRGEAVRAKSCLPLHGVHLPGVRLHGVSRGESLVPALARPSWQLIFAGVPPGGKTGCSCTGGVWL